MTTIQQNKFLDFRFGIKLRSGAIMLRKGGTYWPTFRDAVDRLRFLTTTSSGTGNVYDGAQVVPVVTMEVIQND